MGIAGPFQEVELPNPVATAFLEALNSLDLVRVRAVLAPDFVFEEAAGPGDPSIEAFLHELSMVFSAFPDITFRSVREHAVEERTYLEFRAFGTHRGDFLRVGPTGTTAVLSGVFNLETDESLVRRLRMTADFGGLRRQLLMAAHTA